MPAPTSIQSLREELSAAGEGLAGNEEVLRSVLAGCGDCIKILDLDGNLQFMSEGGKRVMEVEDFSQLKGCFWPGVWQGSGGADAQLAVDTARNGGVGRFKGDANTAKGNPRYWEVQVSPILDREGQPSYLLSISRDITEAWRAQHEAEKAQQRQALLAAELEHRIKNTLTMVTAIARQTLRGSDVIAARDAFMARLITLSHAHDILMKTSWVSAPIQDVVKAALSSHRAGLNRIHITGPDVALPPKQALALSVALHELATNATKYGALSTNGNVNIEWSTLAENGRDGFRFRWSESGGPAVAEPREVDKGFGSRLIEKLLPNEFGGEVRTTYAAGGVICELVSPEIVATAPSREISEP